MNKIPPETRIIVGLHGSDQVFRTKIYHMFQLDDRVKGHYQLWHAMSNECCRQICEMLGTMPAAFLQALQVLPHMKYFNYIQELPHFEYSMDHLPAVNPVLFKEFSDAVKFWGLSIMHALQQTPYFSYEYDYFLEHFGEGHLVLLIYPKGFSYDDKT